MSIRQINYDKLEAFLRGDVSLEDLESRRFSQADAVVMIHALMLTHLDELTYFRDGKYCISGLTRTMEKVWPGDYVTSGHIDASREMGLHHTPGRGDRIELNPPDRLIKLVEQYKDDPNGGIAKFHALKMQQNAELPQAKDGLKANEIAANVIAQLRRCYGPDVLDIIRAEL